MNPVIKWLNRNLSNPQIVYLLLTVSFGLVAAVFMARTLAPVIAAVIIAYVLDSGVTRLRKLKLPKLLCVWIVFASFFAVLVVSFFVLAPVVFDQVGQFIQQMPNMFNKVQEYLLGLPAKYPQFIEKRQIRDLMTSLGSDAAKFGQRIVTFSLNSILALGTYVVYLVLVPLMVFFFLKDKEAIFAWFSRFLPEERGLITKIWLDANVQFSSYIRGKVWEIIVVGFASYITFRFLGLNYSALLGVSTAFSVVIPYIGAAVVTFPVAGVAFFQFGLTQECLNAIIAYWVIQAIDGNILVTILFSEVVKIHPIAIVVAILIFGSFWGFWGVFFAIPLATLVQSIINAWPSDKEAA
ncbi:MAG: AI-2E family transporter [Alphaproteobacteria bacterium]